jgi:hypothetical protein
MVDKDDGCSGCFTASATRPCLVHGCTSWCGVHVANYLTEEWQRKAFPFTTIYLTPQGLIFAECMLPSWETELEVELGIGDGFINVHTADTKKVAAVVARFDPDWVTEVAA